MVGIARNMSDGAFRSSVTKQYQWTFPNALDLGDATSRLYKVPAGDSAVGVVIDPEGNIVQKKGLNWFYTEGPHQGKTVIQAAVDDAMAKAAAGEAVPKEAKPVADLLKRGEYGKALAAAKKLPSAAVLYGDKVVKDIEPLKAAKLDEIRAGAGEDGRKFQAYQAGERFVRVFAAEKEAAEVKALLSKLKTDDAVKKELAAKAFFYQAAECLAGNKQQQAAAVPILEKIRKDYAETVFGRYADAMGAP
jgi:hypothetical protein